MNEQTLHWEDLRVILAIATAGSLSGAARRLSLSHATVFRRLGQVEARLSVTLFERSKKGYRPTEAGDDLARTAAGIEREVAGAERRVLGHDLRLSGGIRVTTTDTLLQGLLTPVFASFRQTQPDIVLDVSVSNQRFDLAARDADVAIRPSNAPPQTLIGRRIGRIEQALYARRGACEEWGGACTDAWIGQGAGHDDAMLEAWMKAQGLSERQCYRCDSLLGRAAAARAGLGTAVLPCYLGESDAGLDRLSPPIDELAVDLWLLTHPDLRSVSRIRVFMDAIAEAVQAQAMVLGLSP